MARTNIRNLRKEKLKKRPKVIEKSYVEVRARTLWGSSPKFVQITRHSSVKYVVDNLYKFTVCRNSAQELLEFLPRIYSICRHGRGSYIVNYIIKTLLLSMRLEKVNLDIIDRWVDPERDVEIRSIFIKHEMTESTDNKLTVAKLEYLKSIAYNYKKYKDQRSKIFKSLNGWAVELIHTSVFSEYLNSSCHSKFEFFKDNEDFRFLCKEFGNKNSYNNKILYKLLLNDFTTKDDIKVVKINQYKILNQYLKVTPRRLTLEAEEKLLKDGDKKSRSEYLKHLRECRN